MLILIFFFKTPANYLSGRGTTLKLLKKCIQLFKLSTTIPLNDDAKVRKKILTSKSH